VFDRLSTELLQEVLVDWVDASSIMGLVIETFGAAQETEQEAFALSRLAAHVGRRRANVGERVSLRSPAVRTLPVCRCGSNLPASER
jgi:hypothetical protein